MLCWVLVEQAGHEHMSDEYKRPIYCSIAEAHTLGTKYTRDHHMVPTTEPTLTIYICCVVVCKLTTFQGCIACSYLEGHAPEP